MIMSVLKIDYKCTLDFAWDIIFAQSHWHNELFGTFTFIFDKVVSRLK